MKSMHPQSSLAQRTPCSAAVSNITSSHTLQMYTKLNAVRTNTAQMKVLKFNPLVLLQTTASCLDHPARSEMVLALWLQCRYRTKLELANLDYDVGKHSKGSLLLVQARHKQVSRSYPPGALEGW